MWPRNPALARNSVLQKRQPWASSSFSCYSVCFDKVIYVSRNFFFFSTFKRKFQSLVNHFPFIKKRVLVKARWHSDFSHYTSDDGLRVVAYTGWQIDAFRKQVFVCTTSSLSYSDRSFRLLLSVVGFRIFQRRRKFLGGLQKCIMFHCARSFLVVGSLSVNSLPSIKSYEIFM